MPSPDPTTPNLWKWKASRNNNPVAGDKIVISASDIAGKIAKLEQELVDGVSTFPEKTKKSRSSHRLFCCPKN
jgi:hypothetical protein